MTETVELKPVPLAALGSLGESDQSDLTFYLPGSSSNSAVLYRAAGFGLGQPDFGRLCHNGVSMLFLHGEQLGTYEKMLETGLARFLQDPAIPPLQKAEHVHYVGSMLSRDLVGGPEQMINLSRATTLLDTVIDSILSDGAVRSSLLQVAAHHRSTASHLFAVSTLGILLALEAFGPDRELMKAIGLAGMLHDVGKLSIPDETLNKLTPLDHAERQAFRQHPIESVRLLGDDAEVTWPVRQMILQHHERVDGLGYPLGLSGSELLPGSKILTIVDSFHALIGKRAYREPLTPEKANTRLASQVGKQFDIDLFARWTHLFGRCWKESTAEPVILAEAEEVKLHYHEDHHPAQCPRAVSRCQPRVPCNGRVQVACIYAGRLQHVSQASDGFVSLLHDISPSGTCLSTSHPMYRGEIVNLLLRARGHDVWVRSMVAWCRKEARDDSYKTGVQFLQRISPGEANVRIKPCGIGDVHQAISLAC